MKRLLFPLLIAPALHAQQMPMFHTPLDASQWDATAFAGPALQRVYGANKFTP